MPRQPDWTREETLAAFALYMHMPTNRISYEEDADIIALASALGRSPGSIALKLQNILSCDPNATRKGFGNAAAMVKDLWHELDSRGDDLLAESLEAYRRAMTHPHMSAPQVSVSYEPRIGMDVEVKSTKRLNQDYFRKCLLDLYDYRCCVTGLSAEPFLVASHIKPWSDSDPFDERINMENGLLLNALHDKAFDRGYISFTDDYEMLISRELSRMLATDNSGVIRWICNKKNSRINPPSKYKPGPKYLKYHREAIFRG